jgi:hypothetical protein
MPVSSRQGRLACKGFVLWIMHPKYYSYSIVFKSHRSRAGKFHFALDVFKKVTLIRTRRINGKILSYEDG